MLDRHSLVANILAYDGVIKDNDNPHDVVDSVIRMVNKMDLGEDFSEEDILEDIGKLRAVRVIKKLRPCPFCGNRFDWQGCKVLSYQSHYSISVESEDTIIHLGFCDESQDGVDSINYKCACGVNVDISYLTSDDPVNDWNRRGEDVYDEG